MTSWAQSLARGSVPMSSFELAIRNGYSGLTVEEPEENEETELVASREQNAVETQELVGNQDTLSNHESDGNQGTPLNHSNCQRQGALDHGSYFNTRGEQCKRCQQRIVLPVKSSWTREWQKGPDTVGFRFNTRLHVGRLRAQT